MNNDKQQVVSRHWPVVILALAVVAIFIVVMVTFQVKQTEYALLKTYSGKLVPYGPGLHFRWPFINSVWRHDNRVQCYELAVGHDEQYMTSDSQQIVISTYVLWKVGNPEVFLRSLDSTDAAERKLSDEVRGARSAIISKYAFTDMVSPDGGSATLARIEDEMLNAIHDQVLSQFGIEIVHIGFRQLGFPAAVTQNIYAAMISEREAKAKKFEDDGQAEAAKILSDANTRATMLTAAAEAEATKIRGQGDAKAAEYYSVFAQDPELASFIRSLDALRVSMGERDTLILDTSTAPFDMLTPNVLQRLQEAMPAVPASEQRQ